MKTTRELRVQNRNRLLKHPSMGGMIADLQNCLRDAYDDLDLLDSYEVQAFAISEPVFVGKMPARKDVSILPQNHETIDKFPEGSCFICANEPNHFITTLDNDGLESSARLDPICSPCVKSLGLGVLIKDSQNSGWYSPNGFESLAIVNKRSE